MPTSIIPDTQAFSITPNSILRLLRYRYPVIAEFKPLRIGIYHEVRAVCPEAPARVVQAALHHHTTKSPYLRAIVAGGPRYALDGSENGIVIEHHQELAKQELAKREPPPPTPPPIAISTPGKPVLKLKPKAGPVMTVSISRRVAS